MAEPGIIKDSCASSLLSLSHVEASTSQDSCSDGTSVTSSTAPTSTVTSFSSSPKTSLSPILKPILKKEQTSFAEDADSVSGYDSDAEYEASFFEDNDDEDLADDSAWSDDCDDCDDISEECSDDESVDGSFITFESGVRFDSEIEYIEAPEYTEEEPSNTEVTFHELIQRAQAFGHILLEGGTPEKKGTGIASMAKLEEYSPDAVDLDKRLFAAYINGINGIADPTYKSQLHTHVENIKAGHAESPFFESDNPHAIYLDNILSHVVGVFRNLVAREEFDELVTLKTGIQQAQSPGDEVETRDKTLVDKIKGVLSDRLGDGKVEIGQDEMTFFANGVSYALGDGSAHTESN